MTFPFLLAQAQAPGALPAPGWSDGPGVVRTLLSLIVVLVLMGGCLWLIRRGGWQGGLGKGPRAVQVETAVGIGDDGAVQHRGIGRRLMDEAERIAREHGKGKMLVISGVGVRGYYARLGYRHDGPYMSKDIIIKDISRRGHHGQE